MRWARNGGKGLQDGQENGLDLCTSKVFSNIGDMRDTRDHTMREPLLRE